MSGGIILTGGQVHDYRLLATLHGLAMEINMGTRHGLPPTACPTHGRALASARRILLAAGKIELKQRLTRRRAYVLLKEYLEDDLGMLDVGPREDPC